MHAEERLERVERIVAESGRVAVAELARRFDVTTETVRRDLAQLEDRGILRRVHGGAVAASNSSRVEVSVSTRRDINTNAKARIAQAAMTLIPATFSGAIAIDAGTTTALFAEHVARWRPSTAHQTLVVITNSISVASIVSENSDVELHMLGGRLRGITSAAVGASTLLQLSHLSPDIAFMGANGVHARFGLSTPDQEEAAVKTALVRGARRVVALVDASKLGEGTLVSFADLGDVDTLITDAEPDPELTSALYNAEVEVLLA
jgi:DeoR family fructose operon transcriptional repressor